MKQKRENKNIRFFLFSKFKARGGVILHIRRKIDSHFVLLAKFLNFPFAKKKEVFFLISKFNPHKKFISS